MMRVTRGSVTSWEVISWEEILLFGALFRQGLMMPSHPKRTGSAIRFLSASLKALQLVSDGRNFLI